MRPKNTGKKTSATIAYEIYEEVEIIAKNERRTISQTIAILVEEAVNARKNAQ
jgi:macrodomain Ter protein organizer (MatP/YcbG family)